MSQIKNIKEVTEPLMEEILKGTRRSRLFRRSQECSYDGEEAGMYEALWATAIQSMITKSLLELGLISEILHAQRT